MPSQSESVQKKKKKKKRSRLRFQGPSFKNFKLLGKAVGFPRAGKLIISVSFETISNTTILVLSRPAYEHIVSQLFSHEDLISHYKLWISHRMSIITKKIWINSINRLGCKLMHAPPLPQILELIVIRHPNRIVLLIVLLFQKPPLLISCPGQVLVKLARRHHVSSLW